MPAKLASLGLLILCVSAAGQPAAGDAAPASSVSALKRLSVEELMDIEVTSVSKRPEKLLEAPAAIQVVSGEDIRRFGASTIADALRLAGNLDVAQKSSHEWVIGARGFTSDVGNKLLVLMDGRTVYTPLFSGVFWSRQDYLLEDIDRIEVISGPGGTLWGANAVNGVINITTKSAKDTQGLYLETGGGAGLQGFAGGRYGGTLAPNISYRVYAKYSDRDSEALGNGNAAHDSWHAGQGGFRLDAGPSAQNLFTLQADVYEGRADVQAGRSRVTGSNILGRWSRAFSSEADMSLQLYYDQTYLRLPVPGVLSAPAGVLEDDLATYDLDFQHGFTWGAYNRLIWGVGYRLSHDVVKNAPGLAFLPPILDQELFSVFAQDEITVVPGRLNLTLGTKLEHNDYTGVEVEPNVRLQWTVTPRQILWGAISRAVRTPSRIDRDLSQPAPGYTLVILKGGSGFVSEKVFAYELGFRTQLGSRASASISAFYNEYRDVRSTSTSPPHPVFRLPFPLFFENNLEGETHGAELGANVQLFDWWQLHGSYSVIKEDIRIKPGRMDFNNARNETADPEEQVSLRSAIDLPHEMELGASWRWVDRRPMNSVGVVALVPAYAELDLRLAWRPNPWLELSVVGRNLLHGRHPEFGVPGPNRVEIQRGVIGKLTWRY